MGRFMRNCSAGLPALGGVAVLMVLSAAAVMAQQLPTASPESVGLRRRGCSGFQPQLTRASRTSRLRVP